MAQIGYIKNGQFITAAQNFDILKAPEANETTSGFMTPTQVEKLDEALTHNNIAPVKIVEDLFK